MDAPGMHVPNAENAADPRDRDAGRAHDPLAGRTDRPGRVPEADFRNVTPTDRRREGMFGGVLIFAIPLAILVVGFLMWSSNIGTDDPAVDAPATIGTEQPMEPAATD
jgi:hypothetical protein